MSIIAYATLSGVQARLGNDAAADAAELQVFCDQVNDWIESSTGRVFGPIPGFSSTLTADAAAGDSTVTLASTSGLQVNDTLMLGPVTGTHESGLVESISGNDVTLATTLVSAFASGTAAIKAYIFDGYSRREGGRILPIVYGIRGAIRSLEVTPVSAGDGGTRPQGGAWYMLPRQDFFIRPVPQERTPGFPATELWITNIPTPGDSTPLFFPGFNNVRIDGDLGWPVVANDIVGVAERAVVGLWQMRASSGAYDVAPMTEAQTAIPHLLSLTDWQLIRRYTRDEIEIV
jgi:hypothetical protein